MSWPSPVCQKDFSRKDNMPRHMNSKHSDSSFAPVIPMAQEKCQQFQLVHPFTCMVAGMTGSGKTVWVQSLLQQSQTVIDQAPERIIWCYSQWQNAYTQLLNRAAVGWAVSFSAFGLLNRAAVGWAVSCSAFGLLFFFSFVGEQIQSPGLLGQLL